MTAPTPHDELVAIFRDHISSAPTASEEALNRVAQKLAAVVGNHADSVVNDFFGRADCASAPPAPVSPLETLASKLATVAAELDRLPAALRLRPRPIGEESVVHRMRREAKHLTDLAAAIEKVQA